MADALSEAWRRAVDANARYYQEWGRLAERYVRDLNGVLSSYRTDQTRPAARAATASAPPSPAPVVPEPAVPAPVVPAPAALVLEGPPGAVTQGAVLVENHLSHPVSAVVESRMESAVEIAVDPAAVELAPGESAVVRVRATVPAGAAAGDEIAGQLQVPELVGTVVPLLVRVLPPAPAAS